MVPLPNATSIRDISSRTEIALIIAFRFSCFRTHAPCNKDIGMDVEPDRCDDYPRFAQEIYAPGQSQGPVHFLYLRIIGPHANQRDNESEASSGGSIAL